MPLNDKTDVKSEPYFGRYATVIAILALIGTALGGAWAGIQIYAYMSEPSSYLKATIRCFPNLAPVKAGELTDDNVKTGRVAEHMLGCKRQVLIELTNTGDKPAKNVRLIFQDFKGETDSVFVIRPTNTTGSLSGKVEIGEIEVESTVQVCLWLEEKLAQAPNRVIIAQDERPRQLITVDEPKKHDSPYGFMLSLIIGSVASFLAAGLGKIFSEISSVNKRLLEIRTIELELRSKRIGQ